MTERHMRDVQDRERTHKNTQRGQEKRHLPRHVPPDWSKTSKNYHGEMLLHISDMASFSKEFVGPLAFS